MMFASRKRLTNQTRTCKHGKLKSRKGFEALDGKVILVGHSIGGDDWEKASILNASLLVAT